MKSSMKKGFDSTVNNELVQHLMGELVSHGIDGKGPFSGAEELAEEYRRTGRYDSVDEMVDSMIRWESSKNFGSGFLAGAGGVVTLPVTIPAGMYTSWVLQARLAAAVALLYGHPLSDPKTRTFILLALVGDRAVDTLKSAGLSAVKFWGNQAVKRIPADTLLKINQAAGFKLLSHAGEGGIVSVSKIVPFAGGVLSGIADALSCYIAGKAAKKIFGGGTLPGNEEYTVVLYEEHLSRIVTSVTKNVRKITLPEDGLMMIQFSGVPISLRVRYVSFNSDVLMCKVEGSFMLKWVAGKVLDHISKSLPDRGGNYISRQGPVIRIRINNLVRMYTGELKGITLTSLDIRKEKISLTLH